MPSELTLPALYHSMTFAERRAVRERYVREQNGKCWHCKEPLSEKPPARITKKKIDWRRFPKNFLRHPVHLQHDHDSGLTEGAVHSYCNAVLWQYHGK